MNARRIFMIIVTGILIVSVFAGVSNALGSAETDPITVADLENVRDFVPADRLDGTYYAVDGGALFAGEPGRWLQVETPRGVLVSTVAVDHRNPERLFIGAANEMAVYFSGNAGLSWIRVPLASEGIGGVTAIAVDSAHRLVFVGTDTDGVYRLRDVGSSMTNTHHLLLDEPVEEVVADGSGQGLAFVRTRWNLYRAENMGLSWVAVDNLPSPATAVAIAETSPATVLVGTANSGLLKSRDGVEWQPANQGLGLVPGSQLHVDALAVDPAQPEVVYVSTSYLLGSTVLHNSPVGVHMSQDGAGSWASLAENRQVALVDLMPLSGRTGAVYAVSEASRTPLALGNAPAAALAAAPAARTAANLDSQAPAPAAPGLDLGNLLAWIVAALAALALLFALVVDLREQRRRQATGGTTLSHSPVHNDR